MTQTETPAKQELLCRHEDDLLQHSEDDLTVNAIRDGKLVNVFWNELTEAEKRAAYCDLFRIY